MMGFGPQRWTAAHNDFGAFSWVTWVFLKPLLYGVLWIVCCTVMESSSFGATFVKRLIGPQIRMLTGARATLTKAFTRNVSKIFWFVFLMDIFPGFLLMDQILAS